jgi:two-component system, NarL family, invasion response regulator UvrY
MNILIADDHTIVREGIKLLLVETYPSAFILDVANAESVLQELEKKEWDVIICDISMPPGDSGLDALKKIRKLKPKIPVIILSMHSPAQYALRVMRAGAMGYLSKANATQDLIKAVNLVINGKKYLSPDVTNLLAESVCNQDVLASVGDLTDREFEVFKLLASGKHISEIARELQLSNHVVNTQRIRIFEKLGLQNNVELIKYALEQKIL